MNTIFADRMKSLGLNDYQLAEKVGCDRSMITKLRHGSATPSIALAIKISAQIGLSIESIAMVNPEYPAIFLRKMLDDLDEAAQ